MVRTRVGYAGGTRANPTYYSLGDHSETIEIEYDPLQISYGDLLAVYWAAGAGRASSMSQQYAAIIHYHGQEQRVAAEASLAEQEAVAGRKLAVDIRPAGTFYPAEAYHQKYYLRSVPAVAQEYEAIYPTLEDFVRSTAVARANGYVGGYGTRAQLEAEMHSMGLSAEAGQALLRETC